jgi:COMPASS component SWD2
VIPLDDDAYLSTLSMPPRKPVITSLTFSPSGIGILVGTAGNVHYIVDSHTGYTLHRLRNHEGLERMPDVQKEQDLSMVPEAGISGQECGWTPDGRFIYSGSSDNKVSFWLIPDYTPSEAGPTPPLTNLFPVSELDGHPTSPTRVVAFNPRHASESRSSFPFPRATLRY